MTVNMASWDRIARLVVAVALILLSAFVLRWNALGILLTVIGVVFILTSLIGWCPLYTVLGFRTKR